MNQQFYKRHFCELSELSAFLHPFSQNTNGRTQERLLIYMYPEIEAMHITAGQTNTQALCTLLTK